MDRSSRLATSLALNAALAVAQVVAGVAARSTGLLADGGHTAGDVVAIGLSLGAVRLALRPPSASRSFGNHRATILAALANATLAALVTALIVVAAAHRLGHPAHPAAGVMLVVAAVSLVVNGAAALVVRDGTRDLNVRSVLLHLVGDALASLAVLVAAAVLLAVPAATWLDPAAALVVATVIVLQAAGVVRAAVAVLFESTPADLDLAHLTATMEGVPGVGEVHDLHVWSLSSELRVLSAHVVLTGRPSLAEAQGVGDRVKAAIAGPYAIAHTTLELECDPCGDPADDPCAMERSGVPAPAAHRH